MCAGGGTGAADATLQKSKRIFVHLFTISTLVLIKRNNRDERKLNTDHPVIKYILVQYTISHREQVLPAVEGRFMKDIAKIK